MNLKTYQAYSMSEVLTRIRQDLGERAVVLHTRTFRRGGILGIGARTVYEVTASDTPRTEFPQSIQPPPQRQPRQQNGTKQPKVIQEEKPGDGSLSDSQRRGSEAEQTILEHLQQHQAFRGRNAGNGIASSAAVPSTKPAGKNAINSAKSNRSGSGSTAAPGNRTPTSADKLLASLSEIGQQADSRVEATKRTPTPARLRVEASSAESPPVPRSLNGIKSESRAASATSVFAEAPLPTGAMFEAPAARQVKTEPTAPLERVAKRFLIDPQTGRAIPASETISRKGKPPVAPVVPNESHSAGGRLQARTVSEVVPAAKALKAAATVESTTATTATTATTKAKKKTARKSSPKTTTKAKTARKSTARSAGTGTRKKASPTAPVEAGDPVQTELAALRELVTQVMEQQQRTAVAATADTGAAGGQTPKVHEALTKHYAELIEHEVAEELANEICGLIQDELSPTELQDDESVRGRILDHLMEYLPVVESALVAGQRDRNDGRPLTMALVGPTGVGKTTTIAKLAASFKLRDQVTVGMITTDTYRIAAVDQLRTYADIIGVPLKVALTPAELASACHALRDVEVILIDTAGRSPNDSDRINEIQSFITAADPHETHLVLSSASSEPVMLRTIERFSTVSADRVIFTKLDEAVNFGVIVNVMRKVGKKLSFITTGQEVPDQIERGESGRLARLILGESLHV